VLGGAWWAAAGDLLLGAVCPGCTEPGWGLCPSCRDRLAGRRPFLLPAGSGVGEDLPTVACSPYDPLLSHLVSAHKDRGALGLAPVLAARLALSTHALLQHVGSEGPVLLVPVPSAADAVRRRGYDATATLARLAARRLRVRYPARAVRLLAQRRGVRDQAGLTAAERSRNVAGAFRLRRGAAWSGRWHPDSVVVLVDDVVTTGSSLAEALRVVRDAGLPVLGGATVAATARGPRGGPTARSAAAGASDSVPS
jgi:predicted amidophosphoribosyltransferase